MEDAGGAADVLAEQTGSDREAVLGTLAPEMMALTTGRLADPQEIADAVVLLASPRSASTTGTEMVVDSALSTAHKNKILTAAFLGSSQPA